MSLTVDGRNIGKLHFQSGNIAKAQFGHRSGDEAIHQFFQAQLEADFHFTSSDEAQKEAAPDPNITMPSMALMLDSVRLQDELNVLKQKLPDSETVLERTDSSLNWPEPEGKKDAEEIWAHLENPATVGELLDGSSCCHYHVAAVLLRLLETEQLMPTLD
jgi:hypothetical protein